MMMMNVQITSQETINPSITTPDHLRYLQISLIDQLNSPFFIPTIYFFHRPQNTTPLETSTFLHKLKTSLSPTLSIYYPLAGRLHNAKYVVCNDEGVPYLHAEVESTRMADIVRKAQISDLDMLIPKLDQKGFPRLMLAIQVNTFSCGGVAIGIKSNHRFADAVSILMLLNAWADITNGKDPNVLPRPYFDTAKLFPPQHNLIDILDDPNPHIIIDKPVAKWFMFSWDKLDRLRSKSFSPKFTSLPSLGTVLSAFIYSRIINSCNNNSKNYEVFVPVNIRPKLSIPYENSFYYGNMIVNAIAKPSSMLNDNELCVDYIERVKESVNKILKDNELIEGMKEEKQDLRFMTDQFDRVRKGQIIALGFSSPLSLHVIQPDFGWGNPVWSMTGTMIGGLVFITGAGPDSKNLIATINLNKEDMVKLEADQVFNSMVFKKASSLASGSKL